MAMALAVAMTVGDGGRGMAGGDGDERGLPRFNFLTPFFNGSCHAEARASGQ